MNEYILEHYTLTIDDKADGKSTFIFIPVDSVKTKALEKEGRKIYIIKSKKEVLYIGEADTSIKTRFQRGFNSYNHFIKTGKARGGYKGYKWLNKKDNPVRNLDVYVAIFKSFKNDREIIEAIEGELVFLIRKKTRNWTKFQNEIHFHNNDKAKEIALSIFNKLKI